MTVNVNKPGIDLRNTLTKVDQSTGVAGEAMLRAETVQHQQTLLGVGRRNWIINGDMKLSQRGTYTSATALSDETYYLDRYEQNLGTVTCTGQQISTNQPAELGGTNSWKLVATSSSTGAFMGTRQIIEDYTVFNGQPFTVSCYVKTNHPSVRFYLWNGSTTVQGYTTAINDGGWHRLEETFTFDASAGTKFSAELIALSQAGGFVNIRSGDYIEMTGFQVELGRTATPYEQRSAGEELRDAQRYYIRVPYTIADGTRVSGGTGRMNTTTNASVQYYFKVPMRGIPTFSHGGTTYLNLEVPGNNLPVTSIATGYISREDVVLSVTSSTASTVGYGCRMSIRADSSSAAKIAFDAEL